MFRVPQTGDPLRSPAVAEVVPAPHPTTCEVCSTPLGLRYWIIDYPRAVHHECRDWSTVRWPFEHVELAL